MIAGEGNLEVGGSEYGLTHTGITGSTDAGGQTGIAVGGFLDKVHSLPTGDVGEAGAILHKEAGDFLVAEGQPREPVFIVLPALW